MFEMSSDDAKKSTSPVSGGMRQILDHNSKLRAQLREAEAERAKQVAEMEAKFEELETAHQAELARVKESMHELNAVRQELEASQSACQKLEQENSTLGQALEQEKSARQKQLEESQAADKLSQQKLEAQKQATTQVKTALDEARTELAKQAEEIKALQARVEKLKPAAVENAKLQGRIAVLQKDLQAETEAKEAQIAECEALRQEGTLQRCQELEAENASMKALVQQREKETEEALKAQEAAEKIAFESRSKLLGLYADEEAKDILKDSLDTANEELKKQAEEIEQLKQQVLDGEKALEDMEYKMLHSSRRDNLRDSLSALAKKRKSDSDSNG